MHYELRKAGLDYISREVSNKDDFLKEFSEFKPHIVLADHSLPSFTGMEAFGLIKQHRPVAFILVTGTLSEQMALDCLNEGIDDFILKSSFKRLPSAIVNAIDKRKMQLQRDEMTSDLIQRNKDLEQFAYIISHNIRGSVANMLGLADFWNPHSENKKEQEFIFKGIKSSMKKLDDVIKDLNYILQFKHGENEQKDIVNFSQLVEDIKQSMAGVIEKEETEIKCDFEVKEIVTIKSYLYSIFYNLIANSIKYKKKGTPAVIEIMSRDAYGQTELVFKDNGIGIDLDKYGDKVFGLYKRFNQEKEGKGMGLFMVKTQVEALAGRIHVHSEPGRGCEFRITLGNIN